METPANTLRSPPGAISAPEPAPIAAAHADHRREDFVFARTQSRAMRAARWERRLPPLNRSLLACAANIAADLMARLA